MYRSIVLPWMIDSYIREVSNRRRVRVTTDIEVAIADEPVAGVAMGLVGARLSGLSSIAIERVLSDSSDVILEA
jgi:hypothetical protein